MTKKIRFLIQKDGNVTHLDASGFGSGCQEASSEIEKIMGKADEQTRQQTANYYQEVDPLILKNEA